MGSIKVCWLRSACGAVDCTTSCRYIEINPTRAVDVQKEEGDKYHVPSMDDLLRVQEEDRVMIRCGAHGVAPSTSLHA